MEPLRRNIPKLYAFSFFTCFLVILPVLVPYWKAYGLSMQDVYGLQAIFGAVVVLLDVPAGYFSDIMGRKTCLILAGLMNGLAYSVLALGTKYWHFVAFEVLVACALALYSGCDVATLYDTLDALGESVGKEALILGRRVYIMQWGEATAAVLGGIAASVSMGLPSIINAFTAWIPFLIALTIVSPPQKKFSGRAHLQNLREIGQALFGSSRLLTFLILANLFFGFATYVAVWSYQSYWESLNVPLNAFGYLWAGMNLLVGVVGRFAPRIEKSWGPEVTIVTIAVLPILGYLGMSQTLHWVGAGLCLLFAFSRGLNQVILVDGIVARVPKHMRATANSVASLGMRSLFVVVGPLIGRSIDQWGLSRTYGILAASFTLISLAIVLPLLSLRSEFRRASP